MVGIFLLFFFFWSIDLFEKYVHKILNPFFIFFFTITSIIFYVQPLYFSRNITKRFVHLSLLLLFTCIFVFTFADLKIFAHRAIATDIFKANTLCMPMS